MLARQLTCLRPASRLSAMFIFNELGAVRHDGAASGAQQVPPTLFSPPPPPSLAPQIPLEAQRAGLGPDRSVVWDYHVVLLEERDLGSTLVWDLDRCVANTRARSV